MISSEEIAGRPDGLFVQELWRPGLCCALQVLYEVSEYPRVRSAVSDNVRITTKEQAFAELEGIRKWWETVKDGWVSGKCVLVMYDANLSDADVMVWMDLNLAVPWFKLKCHSPNLTIDEIREISGFHRAEQFIFGANLSEDLQRE